MTGRQTEGKEATNTEPRFKLVNATQEAEDAYDLVAQRKPVVHKPIGTFATVAHLVKGALGSGLLSGHVAYKKAGFLVAIPLNLLLGIYLGYCIYMLTRSAQVVCKRTGLPVLSYSKLGEAAMVIFPGGRWVKCSRYFGYMIDSFLIFELFGACATYQIIIAKTIKQLVEDAPVASLESQREGYPNFRIYMAAILGPIVLLVLLRHLHWLAPFSALANALIVLCICVTIYYASVFNPKFENMVAATSFGGVFEMTGMLVFSMSCASQCLSVENNMRNPKQFALALGIGQIFIIICVGGSAFFGYVAFLEKSDAPITVNYPMTTFPKVLKGLIAVMIFITHGINFWVPFDRAFFYIQKCHKDHRHIVRWELFYRALIAIIICIIGIVFPSITALMGFLGCFFLSNIAFIWPNIIDLLVVWHKPGLGRCYWRLWKNVTLIIIGIVLFSCGSVVSARALVKAFASNFGV